MSEERPLREQIAYAMIPVIAPDRVLLKPEELRVIDELATAVQTKLQPEFDALDALRQVARGYCPACGRGDAAPTVEDFEQQRKRAEVAENRLRLAHQARRAKEHQLDDIRRALCDIGFMDDDDPYSHADLADVIRQNGRVLLEMREGAETPAPDAGPSVTECGANDRRWPLEKAGE
ncbi:hypothetical protein [Streptomyces sp. NPDC048256]|uniref:hypothetical protein n=1 Tax=Streptomyces sp. NPDC048256 TaxID=3154613 RepID=UPI00340F234C